MWHKRSEVCASRTQDSTTTFQLCEPIVCATCANICDGVPYWRYLCALRIHISKLKTSAEESSTQASSANTPIFWSLKVVSTASPMFNNCTIGTCSTSLPTKCSAKWLSKSYRGILASIWCIHQAKRAKRWTRRKARSTTQSSSESNEIDDRWCIMKMADHSLGCSGRTELKNFILLGMSYSASWAIFATSGILSMRFCQDLRLTKSGKLIS